MQKKLQTPISLKYGKILLPYYKERKQKKVSN